MIQIVHASIDENKKVSGGNAGDQTGKEVCVRSWYSKPWTVVLRYPDEYIAEKAANIGVLLANSNLVGYDQWERNSLYQALKKHDFDTSSYIYSNKKTETDCSAFVTACYVCAGVKSLEYNGNAPTTSTMEKAFKVAGFEVIKESKFLTSDEYLRKGDILLRPGSHTAIAIQSGSRAWSGNNIYYYPPYKGNLGSFSDALRSMGIDNSAKFRTKIANANGIANYDFTYEQNSKLFNLLKQGYLIIP